MCKHNNIKFQETFFKYLKDLKVKRDVLQNLKKIVCWWIYSIEIQGDKCQPKEGRNFY